MLTSLIVTPPKDALRADSAAPTTGPAGRDASNSFAARLQAVERARTDSSTRDRGGAESVAQVRPGSGRRLPAEPAGSGSAAAPDQAAPGLVQAEPAPAVRIELDGPLGDQWQLPVTQAARDWLAGEPMTEEMAADPLVQVLGDSPELAEQLALALETVPAGMTSGLTVLLPAESGQFDQLQELGLPVLAGAGAHAWLLATRAMPGSDPGMSVPGVLDAGVQLPGNAWNTSLPAPTAMMEAGVDKGDATRPMELQVSPVTTRTTELTDKQVLELLTRGGAGADQAQTDRLMALSGTESVLPRETSSTRLAPLDLLAQRIERPLPMPANGAELAREMGERVVMMIGQNLNDALIRLDPPEMGPVEIRIQTGSEQMQVHLAAQQPVVREMLEQQAHRLRDLMGQQGFEDVSLAFSDQGAWSGGEGQADRHTGRLAEPPERASDDDTEDDADTAGPVPNLSVNWVDHYV